MNTIDTTVLMEKSGEKKFSVKPSISMKVNRMNKSYQ